MMSPSGGLAGSRSVAGAVVLGASVPVALLTMWASAAVVCDRVGDCYGSGFDAPVRFSLIVLLVLVTGGTSMLWRGQDQAARRRCRRAGLWSLLAALPALVVATVVGHAVLGGGSGDYMVMDFYAIGFGLAAAFMLVAAGVALRIHGRQVRS
jgi:hypothetical protein